mgnify:FL=1
MKYTREEARESVKWYVEAYLNDNLDKDTYINGLMDELTFDENDEFDTEEQGLKIPARHNKKQSVITIF